MITRTAEVIDYENRWIQVCFDHVRFPDGNQGRYTRIRHRSGIPGVVVLAVKVATDEISVGLIQGHRYPVGRVCVEAVRVYGCLVTGPCVVEPDATEFTTELWLPLDDVWHAIRDGRIACAMTLAALLRAVLAGLISAPGAQRLGISHVHQAVVTAGRLGVDLEKVSLLAAHPSVEVRAAASRNLP